LTLPVQGRLLTDLPSAMAAAKRRKSVMTGGSSSSRKGDSPAFDLNSVLAFTADTEYKKDSHPLAFYRLAPGDPGRSAPCVRGGSENSGDKSGDKVAAALGFPSAFVALDFNDKGGAWHGDRPRLQALGEDPEKESRCAPEGATAPAGLKNLGATCYLNSLLQYLFFNRDFRSVCLNIHSEHDAVNELQRVFALMAAGERCAVDPTEFAKALELDTREEADVSEFSSLLLDFLETYCVDSADKFNFIQALFQGKTSQILVCQEDQAHRVDVQPEPFLMLQARLTLTPRVQQQSKGEATVVSNAAAESNTEGAIAELASGTDQPAKNKRMSGRKKVIPPVRLEQLLQDSIFPDEVLEDWQCPHCKKKVAASKKTRLIKAPPYLHVTIERSHYDLKKDERKKLNDPVSFPRKLELRVHTPPQVADAEVTEILQAPTPLTATSTPTVVYECIGYLEHVSDSAHSGHYTATLFDEDANVVEALSLAAKADGATEEPATKRRRHSRTPEPDPADAAAGAPPRGAWWSLDDDRINPIVWKRADAGRRRDDDDGDSLTGVVTPDRIQSSAAYLVLYRRCNHKPGQLARDRALSDAISLPPSLSQFVSSRNGAFNEECKTFKQKTSAITKFIAERQQMVKFLATALRLSSTSGEDSSAGHSGGSIDLSSFRVVPTRWLNDFLRGEDCSNDDLLNGEKGLAPVVYGPSLLRSQGKHLIDPLAVWCGEVKLVSDKALEETGGRCRGFDLSSFLSAEEAIHPEMCESLWRLYKTWCEEFRVKSQIVQEGKLSKGCDTEAVWVSQQVYNAWSKTAKDGDASSPDKLWTVFLKEVASTRWTKQHSLQASPSKQVGTDEEHLAKDKSKSEGTCCPANPCLTSLVGGLTCMHGLVNRPRAGVLIKLSLVVDLLAIARQKTEAYQRLWPDSRRVPELVSGLADAQQLLGADDICKECGPSTASSSGSAALGSKALGQRTLVVRRRYPASKIVRRQGEVTLPSDGTPITAGLVRDLIQKELGQPVLSLFTDAGAQAKDVELHHNEIIGEEVESIIMIKEENATYAERETAAFKGSIFCKARN